jgi:hypothetical protein
MKSLTEMTKDEKSLLLFFECVAADSWGKFSSLRLNNDDWNIADNWKNDGFIQFGRMPAKYIFDSQDRGLNPVNTHWVRLSEEAFELAYQERKNRAQRNYINLDNKLAEYGFSVNGRIENEN